GWNRFPVAEREVERLKEGSGGANQAELGRDFQAFLSNLGGQGTPRNQSERDAMFREFLGWRQKQGHRRPREAPPQPGVLRATKARRLDAGLFRRHRASPGWRG